MTQVGKSCFVAVLVGLSTFAASAVRADEGLAFFESKVRPLLLERCIECHGGAEPEGGLSLDSRAGWQEAGVVERGSPDESLLIRAIRHTDDDIKMPPEDAGGKLNDAEIAILERWVQMGAPDPRELPAGAERAPSTGPKLRSRVFKLSDADRKYWAFQPVIRPVVSASNITEPRNLIDTFVLAKLEEQGLAMNPEATPREQVRRAYFDLWGLPPSPEEVATFEANPTEAAWAELIDRLLASPHYGERWGRHWLDVVRYAESNGYERDGEKPHAWRYRDYVIGAFNDDKPYDQFVREQLAGDEFAEAHSAGASTASKEWRDAIVATGFYRLHVWDDEPDSTVAAEYDDFDDIIVTTSAAFLGLTIGCARCHDHKFDPISQADYYSLLSFLRGIDTYGQHKTGGGGRGTGQIERLLALPAELQQWKADQNHRVIELEQRVAQATDEAAKHAIEAELKQAREVVPPFDSALAVAEKGSTAPITHVLHRGDANSPREEAPPAIPAVFGVPLPTPPAQPETAMTCGRRRQLADWIASPANPLTARVMVNRLWQHHFGTGIVPTPDDFGHTGLPPTNQPLLNYLAAEFMDGGWQMKRMHRLIMTSRVYRQSSRAGNPKALQVDAENSLLWRQNLRRVEAEVIRDTMLTVSGALSLKQGGPSLYPSLSQETRDAQNLAGNTWQESPVEEQNRRSVYLVVKRGMKVPLLESLDFANSTSPAGIRPVTTTAPQALMLLNDAFVQSQATALAARVAMETDGDVNARVKRAFELVLQRDPTLRELDAARSLLSEQQLAAAEGATDPDLQAFVSFCRALLNCNEMIYID
ncbi:MAG: PSD1 and planctomycete cytochrome C domain-containing protein [Pirellulales bacterium]